MCVNIKHKNSVFSSLFSEPEILRELYSAIKDVEVPEHAIIDINTLSDALFMGQINDVSFTIDNRIVVLIEHQSTISNNVPTRLLMYIGRVYEKILDREKLYQKNLVKIPTPEFIVLYNGKEEYPDYNELRLSDAFIDTELDKSLELKVKVYNINHGRNPEILEKSKNLDGYSFFIDKIRQYNKDLSIEESVKKAIKYCIDHDILKHYLKKHASEVVNMLFEEISIEEIVAIRSREAREEGREEGLEQGRENEKIIIAQNLLSKGSSLEFVQEITGLDLETIQRLSS